MKHSIQLSDSWLAYVADEFEKPYMQSLKAFLQQEKQAGKKILPPNDPNLDGTMSHWFLGLNNTSFEHTKVVIIGQDPYPTEGHAHGLCFSVQPHVQPLPKSLININKELLEDLGVNNQHSGFLLPWARQGVLLLNAVLTVEAGNANSHQGKGWETFTDAIIQSLNEHKENLVFILWGSYAQKKGAFINTEKHLVIKSPHPSPLSAYRGFFGSKPFSRANQYLLSNAIDPIDWQLSETPHY